ncbi:MAG: sulfite exporter TauE/SafE family protein, partial [Rhodobacteraceae bacterium]|nr:sulfite exporter TauE/SafE family protein [Paracoccaceae bacterium]
AALGFFTAETLWAGVLLAPFALAGAWVGVIAHRALSEKAFFAITYVLLTITGTKLIWDSLV